MDKLWFSLAKTSNVSFGEAVKVLRTRKDMSSRQLSELCGLSAGYMSKVERDLAVPSATVFGRLVLVLGCTQPESDFLLALLANRSGNEVQS